MTDPLSIALDRSARTSLAEQIRSAVATAIENGVLAPGARLPSWIDLATQLGVARGTVRAAYEKLLDAQLVVASTANGTRVAERPPDASTRTESPASRPFMMMYRELAAGNMIFKMGVPAHECFPAKLFSRIRARSIRAEAGLTASHPDRQGEPGLRREIAAHLALARGLKCSPSQVFITAGFAAGLGLTLLALGLEGRKAWMEDPGFPLTRRALEIGRLSLVPVPVDDEGIDVDYGIAQAPDAALALLTPGQQAPLGTTLSLSRRLKLLEWTESSGAFIIEDDYLSELQLKNRAAPALASLDRAGRVIHMGSFSKTLTPNLRLGFIVVPPELIARFADCATCLAPAPGTAVQLAMTEFMREGHYMRHLRRTKRVYSARGAALLDAFARRGRPIEIGGLAALLPLPIDVDDIRIAREALKFGLAPVPLSPWRMLPSTTTSGLLLGIATTPTEHLDAACDRMIEIIERLS
ncbi:MocR-like pyridoxine biosynthesis transcription factor PdxR [Ancylobacter amanitiformis]|uniref:GntR family transcriptional regulator/MocR family aminotransferase n=1 Tax=Ancylobacter amanitiformis TaxID=217069 RepID=A0ABU0LV36_9HYPH|nr:PLP-dependent aminotransferase family protein [Ancylobacter amanitiformis]MDQ0512473.1 GntR family transcriptional regulator/MocR family aminotransferase [Ancylobacter amanitiformis]